MGQDLKQPFELFGINSMKLAEQRSCRIPANWKLVVENYQECYHCGPSHPEFAQIHAMAKSSEVFQTAQANFSQANQDYPKFMALNCYFDAAEKGQEGYQYDRNPLLGGALSGSLHGNLVRCRNTMVVPQG